MGLKAKDIAELLGVSTATVSLVLNNKPGVGEQKRQEIIEKIRELGCEHMLKEIPVNNGSIGFVVFKTYGTIIDESPFFTYLLEGINKSITENGYSLTFIYMNQEMTQEEQKKQLLSMGCRGLIIFGVEMARENLQVFIDSGIPFTVLDNSFEDSDVDSVAINNSQGTSKAIQYLYSMGHKEIGYLHCTQRITSFHERFRAFRRSLKHLGLKFHQEYVCSVEYSQESIREGVRKFLQESKKVPTAFFAENDFLACHAIQGIWDAGYRVPEDISLVGFGDRPICQLVSPKMTTISVPKNDFGISAVNLLMEKINCPRDHSIKMMIGTKLIVRDSVKELKENL